MPAWLSVLEHDALKRRPTIGEYLVHLFTTSAKTGTATLHIVWKHVTVQNKDQRSLMDCYSTSTDTSLSLTLSHTRTHTLEEIKVKLIHKSNKTGERKKGNKKKEKKKKKKNSKAL